MNIIKSILLSLVVVAIIVVASGYTKNESEAPKKEQLETVVDLQTVEKTEQQTISLFVTHGHCSTPFAGVVNNLQLDITSRSDQGNPLENMALSFEVDPNTFNVCRAEELTPKIRQQGLFVGKHNEKITFKSTNVYTMGLDWYQVNGNMSIKGIEKKVKFFVTGIRNPQDQMASSLVLSGQVNLFDWGIDYDKIVNGKSDNVPTKLLYLNMQIDALNYQTPLVTVNEEQ
ncbi:MAG: YceI family protein [Kordia sp.]|uniref:YceI family protein n=1 Tax=Kordia sp. TaxID=1965332 RepID=UPI00385A6B44